MAALCRSLSLLPSPQSSVLRFQGLPLSASSPLYHRGNSTSFPRMQQAAWDAGQSERVAAHKGSAKHKHNYLFQREVETDFFWRTDLLFVVSERGWLPAAEAGRGCAQGSSAGSRTQHPGELEDRKRGPKQWWQFPLPSSNHPEQGRKGLPVGENRKSSEISMCASTGAVPVHTCPHVPFEPAQLPDIYLCLCCRQVLWALLLLKCTFE